MSDLVIPQPGQGKPVSILCGHNDCDVSTCVSILIITYGITKAAKAPAIPYNFLRNLNLFCAGV